MLACEKSQTSWASMSERTSGHNRTHSNSGDHDVSMDGGDRPTMGRSHAGHSRTPSFGMDLQESHSRNNSWNSATNHRADLDGFMCPETPKDTDMTEIEKDSLISDFSSSHTDSQSRMPPLFDSKFFFPTNRSTPGQPFVPLSHLPADNPFIPRLQNSAQIDSSTFPTLGAAPAFGFTPQGSPGSLPFSTMSLNPSRASSDESAPHQQPQSSPFGFINQPARTTIQPQSFGLGAPTLPPLDRGSPTESSHCSPQPSLPPPVSQSGGINNHPVLGLPPTRPLSRSRSTSPQSAGSAASAASSSSYSPFPPALQFGMQNMGTAQPHVHDRSPLGDIQPPFKREVPKRRRQGGAVSRKKTNVACTNCVRAKAGCDTQRPCSRCIRLGKEELCRDRSVKTTKRSTKKKKSSESVKSAEQQRRDFQFNLEKKQITERISMQLDQMRAEQDKEALVQKILTTIKQTPPESALGDTNRYEVLTAEMWDHHFKRGLAGYSTVGLQLMSSLFGRMVHPDSASHANMFSQNLLSLVVARHVQVPAQPEHIEFRVIDNNADQIDLNLEFRASNNQWDCVVTCSATVFQITHQSPVRLLSHMFFDESGWTALVESVLAIVGYTSVSQFPIRMTWQGQAYHAQAEIRVADVAPGLRSLRSFGIRLPRS